MLAAAARLDGLAPTLAVAYLAYVANLGLVTLALSPSRDVTRGGLAAAESVFAILALVTWWARGRPGLPLRGAVAAVREVVSDPASALFLALVAGLLGYELLVGLAAPVIRWDSLTYHLARAAAWAEHGGVYWIANAPDVRMNAFQPLAEQQILFLFVAGGRGALSTLPQFVAELAILVAVYGASRRLGFGVRPAACGAFLLATFSLVWFESTTSDNDLVAASLPAVAACLLLGEGGGRLEPALAGAAAACGLGVKLTTVLVLPILAWLALRRGRRAAAAAAGGGLVGLVALGMWGYVFNLVHTGHLLGAGTGAFEDRAAPGYPRSLANAFDFVYGTMDLSDLSTRLIEFLALGGVLAAVAAWTARGRGRAPLGEAAGVATPFLAPLLVLGGAAAVAFVAGESGVPIRGPRGAVATLDAALGEVYTRIDNENYAAFGPLAIVALLAASALALRAVRGGQADGRRLALVAALPSFLVLISLGSQWSPYLMRFFLVPAALAAPLLAGLFRGRATTAAYAAVAALTAGMTVVHDQARPLASPYGPPWALTQGEAFAVDYEPYLARTVAAYARLVPAHACVGALLGPDEANYLLFGPDLRHRVEFLPTRDPLGAALADGLLYVVIGDGPSVALADPFRAAGWRIRSLAGYWLVASEPGAGAGRCTA
jgi:hypothetical protein